MELYSLFPIQILRLLLNQVTYDCPHFKICVLKKKKICVLLHAASSPHLSIRTVHMPIQEAYVVHTTPLAPPIRYDLALL